MELIEFAEKQGEEAAKFSLATLEGARLRCHQFLVLLLSGAGALCGVGLSQWAQNRFMAAPALVVSMWWFMVAAWIAVRGLRSSLVTAWTHEGVTVLEMHHRWEVYNAELLNEGKSNVNPMNEVRRSVLRGMQQSAEQYRTASTYAARALDQAYLATAATPIWIALSVSAQVYFG